MMKRIVIEWGLGLVISTIWTSTTIAETYDDVAVIVNVNSSSSVAIAQYFQAKRSIPAVNMLYVQADTVEEIDSTQFEALRAQVEDQITSRNLTHALNYIVTTKGVPLKVNRGDTFSSTSPSSSVESELALILGNNSSYIGARGRCFSGYYNKDTTFKSADYGCYLVTRLDGYTVEQVLQLIDRSGPLVQVPDTAKFVLDEDPMWESTLPGLNREMRTARDLLGAKGKVVRHDGTTVYLTNETNVIGYVSWGSNDYNANNYTIHAIPHHSWAPGAIAETYVSTSGRSFEAPPSYGQSLISDLVQEGVSGVKGYVYEPFSFAMAQAGIFLERYASGYNLAESFHMASRYFSWMDVIIGDPKTSIEWSTEQLPIQLAYLLGEFPSMQNITLKWGTVTELNNYGFIVQWKDTASTTFEDIPNSFVPGHGTTLVPQHYAWTHENAPPGTYYYRLKQIDLDGTLHYSEACLLSLETSTSVAESAGPVGLTLAQNYPNPFNPSTVIPYTLAEAGNVTVKVYSALGQEIATLVDEFQQPGDKRVEFSASNAAASGVFFYSVVTARQTITKKMLLLR